ncbi:MAG: hypothetical protein WCR96_00935 [Candidatus Methanomethylophilaceae archaeon]
MKTYHFQMYYFHTAILMGIIISIITKTDFYIAFSALIHACYYKK